MEYGNAQLGLDALDCARRRRSRHLPGSERFRTTRGRAWCETDVEATDLETVIQDLLDGQFSEPVRVVSFNTGEGWSRDISANVAEELRRRCELEAREVPPSLAGFFARHETLPRQLTLRLV